MNIGSIVVILPPGATPHPSMKPYIKWLPLEDEKTEYMIRDMAPWSDDGHTVIFEEGVIGTLDGDEIGVWSKYLREVLPPGSDMEEINEALKAPVGANCILIENT